MKSDWRYQAKTHLPRLLSQVENGETITISDAASPSPFYLPPTQRLSKMFPRLPPGSGRTARSRLAFAALLRPAKSSR